MNFARLKELFASFLCTRHIARRYRRLILLDTQSAGTNLL